MTQEDKELLLKDLCARLPYGVIVQYKGHNTIIKNKLLTGSDLDCNMEYYKPYLRTMSSMTEEEKNELKQISNEYLNEWENAKTSLERWKLDAKVTYQKAVFYNSKHLDWNDLISKGLAIEITEENNPY